MLEQIAIYEGMMTSNNVEDTNMAYSEANSILQQYVDYQEEVIKDLNEA